MSIQKLGPNQQAWVDALRANPEKQIAEVLGDLNIDKYCCLGMLCKIESDKLGGDVMESFNQLGLKISSEEQFEAHYKTVKLDEYGDAREDDDFDLFLPEKLSDMYKFRSREGHFYGKHVEVVVNSFIEKERVLKTFTNLAELNDAGASWKEIADIIEENPGRVFYEEY